MAATTLLALFLAASLGVAPQTATINGRIVDADTSEAVAKVTVIVTVSQQTTTDERGSFTLSGLEPGELDLYITAVGYGVVKKSIAIVAGDNTIADIALSQEASAVTEQVTVTAKAPTAAGPSEKTLSKAELQALSMVILGDPLRAVHAMPGVVASNDLRSDFAIRGAGFDRVGVYVDGVQTESFIHRLAESGTSDQLSLSIINQDTISAVSLSSGAFPVTYGDRTAAVLNLETREGSRVRRSGRVSTGLLATSVVMDGPLAKGRGSWLVAGRTSYLDYVQRFVERITGTGEHRDGDGEPAELNFSDVQAKVVYDLSSRQQVGASVTGGLFAGHKSAEDLRLNNGDLNTNDTLQSTNRLITAFWRFAPTPRAFAQARLFDVATQYGSKNEAAQSLDSTDRHESGLRADGGFVPLPNHFLEAGAYIRLVDESGGISFFASAARPLPPVTASYRERAFDQAYYLQDTWTLPRVRLSLTGGARLERSGLIDRTLVSPRLSAEQALSTKAILRLGVGRYFQAPAFEQLFGYSGNADLGPERATHINVSVEHRVGERGRAVIEAYDREDRDLIFSLSEPRIEHGALTVRAEPYRNAFRGHARGIELSLQRRSANGLTGWLSYAYGKTTLHDEGAGLEFPSDADQRHTVSLFGNYRFTDMFAVTAQWRYGSGTPVPGFFVSDEGVVSLGEQRNRLRVRDYSRADLRASKVFLVKRHKLTLSGEVLNIFNHRNEYPVQTSPFRLAATGGFTTGFRKSFGVLPAVGLAVEF